MKNQTTSQVMKSAWRLFRALPFLTFSKCLTMAWEIEKEIKREERVLTNRIVQKLHIPNVRGTIAWFRIIDSKENKRRTDPEVVSMLSEGFVPLFDLQRKQRQMSGRFDYNRKRQRTPRPRIVSGQGERISIEQACTEMGI